MNGKLYNILRLFSRRLEMDYEKEDIHIIRLIK